MSCHNYPDKSAYGIIRDNGQGVNQCDNGGNLGDVCRLKCDTITSGGRDFPVKNETFTSTCISRPDNDDDDDPDQDNSTYEWSHNWANDSCFLRCPGISIKTDRYTINCPDNGIPHYPILPDGVQVSECNQRCTHQFKAVSEQSGKCIIEGETVKYDYGIICRKKTPKEVKQEACSASEAGRQRYHPYVGGGGGN